MTVQSWPLPIETQPPHDSSLCARREGGEAEGGQSCGAKPGAGQGPDALGVGVDALVRAGERARDGAAGEVGRAEQVVGRADGEDVALVREVALAVFLGAAAWRAAAAVDEAASVGAQREMSKTEGTRD